MGLSVSENVTEVMERLRSAARKAGRDPSEITLVAVTKSVDVKEIREAISGGLRVFGENYIQEALEKVKKIRDKTKKWHFIGHLQTNKARDAVRYFSCIHSIDSVKLLHQIEKEASKLQKQMDVLLEVNLGGEETKYGFAFNQLQDGLEASKGLTWSGVRGFMIIPPFREDPEAARPYFRQLRELLQQKQPDFPTLQELSMGMSHDYVVAVQEGATMVRIGTALFGERG